MTSARFDLAVQAIAKVLLGIGIHAAVTWIGLTARLSTADVIVRIAGGLCLFLFSTLATVCILIGLRDLCGRRSWIDRHMTSIKLRLWLIPMLLAILVVLACTMP